MTLENILQVIMKVMVLDVNEGRWPSPILCRHAFASLSPKLALLASRHCSRLTGVYTLDAIVCAHMNGGCLLLLTRLGGGQA
mmetsp:Transcript_36891/g.91793  ORF Transcript_36891/g.91793 Transcript_36891/m.91793 type:complete len:82 (+) Transcript_36891:1047-1292(+)